MGLLDRFKRKKENEKSENVKVESKKSLTELQEFLGNDQEMYKALSNSVFLDPRKIEVQLSEAAANARESEKEKDFVRSKVWYKIAGGLAIYKGDVKKVTAFFTKLESISPEDDYPILVDPKKAVLKAQEYYKKYLEGEA